MPERCFQGESAGWVAQRITLWLRAQLDMHLQENAIFSAENPLAKKLNHFRAYQCGFLLNNGTWLETRVIGLSRGFVVYILLTVLGGDARNIRHTPRSKKCPSLPEWLRQKDLVRLGYRYEIHWIVGDSDVVTT